MTKSNTTVPTRYTCKGEAMAKIIKANLLIHTLIIKEEIDEENVHAQFFVKRQSLFIYRDSQSVTLIQEHQNGML